MGKFAIRVLFVLEILLLCWTGTYVLTEELEKTTFDVTKYPAQHEAVVNIRSMFSQCSGVIGKFNYVITAKHCVEDDSLYAIMFHDGEIRPGYAVYMDPYEDFAIIRTLTAGYPEAHLSDRDLEFGEVIYHIRYNEGESGQWAGNGLYSSYVCDSPLVPTEECMHWLAFAGIPGDSGGAVFDHEGYVIGIMSMSYWPIGAPMSMAVPVHHILEALEEL